MIRKYFFSICVTAEHQRRQLHQRVDLKELHPSHQMQIRVSYDINVNSAHGMSGGNRLTDSYVNIHPHNQKRKGSLSHFDET